MKQLLLLIIALLATWTSFPLLAQEAEDEGWIQRPEFEAHPPLRPLKCGLWINSIGDIAYKDMGCEIDTIEEARMLANPVEGQIIGPPLMGVDSYLTWTYNIKDSITDDMTEEDYTSYLKDVIDTTSFRMLSNSFFMDKNHIYVFHFMACGGTIFIAHDLDRKTFRICKENSDFACDKNNCFAMGRYIEGADPKTFRPINNKENYLLSRDKNHVYEWDRRLDGAAIAEWEKQLGIKLRK